MVYLCAMQEIELGQMNKLVVERQEPQGMYLRADDVMDQVLLPNAYIHDGLKIGDEIEVFVYLDNEERITATTLKPKILLNQIASLTVDQVNSAGAFVDMGIVKQLLIPYKEQASPMEEGRSYPVYLYIDDKSGRLVGTTKIDRYLSNENLSIEVGEKVDLIILNPTQLGRNVVINQKHEGLIFNSDVNQPLKSGQSVIGYIKTVREDNKIDVVLQQQGVESIEPNAQKILSILEKNGGKLELNDKSDPELIMKKVFMSKKSFKKAIGNLYKARKIKIQDTGIVML